jgi:hypothetical protein
MYLFLLLQRLTNDTQRLTNDTQRLTNDKQRLQDFGKKEMHS